MFNNFQKLLYVSILAIFGLISTGTQAATITYTDETLYSSMLTTSVLDTYSDAGYYAGDKTDLVGLDIHTDAHMSAVLGETQYTTTFFDNHNIINQNGLYCAGCNGSFNLDFTSTSVGTASGVFGVGFNFFNSSTTTPYYATVSFSDGTVTNYLLDIINPTVGNLYWGIVSDELISSIHFGLIDGGITASGSFGIDNLLIGDGTTASVPEPSTALMLMIGLLGFLRFNKKS